MDLHQLLSFRVLLHQVVDLIEVDLRVGAWFDHDLPEIASLLVTGQLSG